MSHEAAVQIPLAMMNRHGLVAGATGTGKTKTLQVMAEQLSAAGVPVFVADVKGDVSELAAPGEAGGGAEKRMADLGLKFDPASFPVTLALGGIGPGVPVRTTVSDFGPQLLAKVLDAPRDAESSLALVFHYADAKGLALLDLADLRALLTFLDSDDRKAELQGIGGLSKATVGVLLRSLVALETGGGNELFGEPQLDVADLLRVAEDGRGVISCLELAAVQDKPKLFSTALMWLLAELFETLPEAGDLPKPKLVFFFDEAHLLFDDATEAFLDAVAQTVRLIRSRAWACSSSPRRPRTCRATCSASSATACSTRCAPSPPRTPRRSRPPSRPSPRWSSTTSRSCCPRWGSARPRSPSCRSRGCRRPSCTRAWWRRAPGWPPPTTSPRSPPPRRCASTPRAWSARARTSCSPHAWSARASPRPPSRRPPDPADGARARSAAPWRAGAEALGRRRGHRRLPHLAPGQGAAALPVRGVFGMLRKRL